MDHLRERTGKAVGLLTVCHYRYTIAEEDNNKLLTEYVQAALKKAKYEILKDDGSYYGEIPELRGVWANADTLEECRNELREVLEDWILIGKTQSPQ